MEKVKVAIIDSGIAYSSKAAKYVSKTYALKKDKDKVFISKDHLIDHVGHGSAVAEIISERKDIEIVSFRICNDVIDIEEEELILILTYIYDNLDIDIINISAGITYTYQYNKMFRICRLLDEKGVILVSAFDNDGAISYPAALPTVIGVDVMDEYEDKREIRYVENSIVDIYVPNRFYRTSWKDQKTILKGTSFAAAYITGLLSELMKSVITPCNKKTLLRLIATHQSKAVYGDIKTFSDTSIKKAIIFPVNKESHALMRFKENLSFEIERVFDERLSGNVGKIILGEEIGSFDDIDWDMDFDTIILSCISELSYLTKRDYSSLIVKYAVRKNKQIYSFEKLNFDYDKIFYPEVTRSMLPGEKQQKLHRITMPVVGILGTSSKQGKFTLQLQIINKLSEFGYNVGHLATEPSGFLFGADSVYHFGYRADLKVQPWDSISLLNTMVWNSQVKGREILVTGCQSGTLHYNDANIESFLFYQYAYILGVVPDLSILCINPHDDRNYVGKTIDYINVLGEGKVRALVIYPVQAIETISGINYKTKELLTEDLEELKSSLRKQFDLPVYILGNEDDLEHLCEMIIAFF